MKAGVAPVYEEAAQRLADLHERLDLIRYPARLEMLRAVQESALRAQSMARLEDALSRMPRS